MCSHLWPSFACRVSSSPMEMNRMTSCGVSCSTMRHKFESTRGCEIAEAGVGEERAFRKLNLQDHVEHRALRIDLQSAHHPRLQARHVESDGSQAAAEQHVLLEAIAAATRADHFGLQRRRGPASAAGPAGCRCSRRQWRSRAPGSALEAFPVLEKAGRCSRCAPARRIDQTFRTQGFSRNL